MTETTDSGARAPSSIPRAVLLLGLAASFVIVMIGIKAFGGSLGPVFLALVLVLLAQPARDAVLRWGAPGWVGLLVTLMVSFAMLVTIGVSLAWAGAKLVAHLTSSQYSDDWQRLAVDVADELHRFGVSQDQIDRTINDFNITSISGQALDAASGLIGFLSSISVIALTIVFLATDTTGFKAVFYGSLADSRPNIEIALSDFADATRRYFVVTTMFGALVAAIDVGFLWILGIPLALVWGLVAIITSFIPNIGFVVGALPPVILALLREGASTAILVFAGYFIINLIIDSVIKPKIVGDEVGLSATLTFGSLVFWGWILGPLGALLAVPLTLFVKALLIDSDEDSRWISNLMSLTNEPMVTTPHPTSGQAGSIAGSEGAPGPTG